MRRIVDLIVLTLSGAGLLSVWLLPRWGIQLPSWYFVALALVCVTLLIWPKTWTAPRDKGETADGDCPGSSGGVT
jgi:hypothetical protein